MPFVAPHPLFGRALFGPRPRLARRSRRPAPAPRRPPRFAASAATHTTVLLVPTGVAASIGGYAGDALPAARLLAAVTDTLVTHPNVLNAALLYWPLPNALYVEGLALDHFAAGAVALRPVPAPRNRIGLLLDAALPPDARLRHIQAADAARATLGLAVHAVATTDVPVRVTLSLSAGASWGAVSAPAALLRAARTLLRAGCDAIAVVADFPDDHNLLPAYRAASGVDPVAGAEAVISHLLTRELAVPVAHAPSLPPLPPDPALSPKAAAEELGYTFLSCVLVGLARAPHLAYGHSSSGLTAADVDVVVCPVDTFGGPAVMSLAARHHVLVIAVEENRTAMRVSPASVGIHPSRVVTARSYAEAAGFVAAHRAGIHIRALSKHVPPLQEIVTTNSQPLQQTVPVSPLNHSGR